MITHLFARIYIIFVRRRPRFVLDLRNTVEQFLYYTVSVAHQRMSSYYLLVITINGFYSYTYYLYIMYSIIIINNHVI